MEQIVILRHGQNRPFTDPDNPGGLSPYGEDEIRRLAHNLCKELKWGRLRRVFSNRNLAIVSSPVKRALESAQIIAAEMGLEVYIREGLDVFSHYAHVKGVLTEFGDFDIVILVTHQPVVKRFPAEYFRHQLEVEPNPFRDPDQGESLIIDSKRKRVRVV